MQLFSLILRGVRNGYDRPGTLLLGAVAILAAWLQTPLRVAWALFVAVAMLITYGVRIAMRPSFYLTEAGDYLLTEAGDRLLLE